MGGALLALAGAVFLKTGVEVARTSRIVAVLDVRAVGATVLPGYRCAGFQVGPSVVITAAHCVEDIDPDFLAVTSPGQDLCAASSTDSLLSVRQVEIPVSYESPWRTDFAQVSTDSDAAAPGVETVIGGRPIAGEHLLAYGWAGGAFEGGSTCPPRGVSLFALSDAECQQRLGAVASQFDPSGSFCAVGVAANTCQGDSGGPVFRAANNEFVGIVSWGTGCDASDVGVYAIPGPIANHE